MLINEEVAVDIMKIVRIEPLVEDAVWEKMGMAEWTEHIPKDLRPYVVTYKVKGLGNKHLNMTVFAVNEVQAIPKAMQAMEQNLLTRALQALTK